MFDQETELIVKTVLLRTISNQQMIAVKDILAADIPYPLKTFIRADVELMLLDEWHHYQKVSRFAFSHPEVQSLQRQMNSVLVLHYSFERADFLQRLDDTVHLIINYLIRPQWTLANVLFEKEETIAAKALMRMLRYFGPYEYLKDIIVRYIQEKHATSFRREEFTKFLWKIDGEYIRRKTGDEVSRIMSPIFEFLDFPKNTGVKCLPVKGLMKFFEDKGMISVLNRLEGELVQGKNELNRRETGELLDDIRRTSGAFEIEQPEEPTPVLTDSSQVSSPPALLEAIRTITIDEDNRRKFTKKIFLEDDQAFADALQALHTLPTWKQASVFIDEIFIRNNVDPYSSEAKRFIEVLFQQFHPQT